MAVASDMPRPEVPFKGGGPVFAPFAAIARRSAMGDDRQ
jgi:hypothetical protein